MYCLQDPISFYTQGNNFLSLPNSKLRVIWLKQLMRSKHTGFRTTSETVNYSQVGSILWSYPNINRNVFLNNHMVTFSPALILFKKKSVISQSKPPQQQAIFFLRDIWPITRKINKTQFCIQKWKKMWLKSRDCWDCSSSVSCLSVIPQHS